LQVAELLGDVAGSTFDATADEIAVIVQKK